MPAADQYYLEFNGANSSASVYVNGKKVASHDGGYSTFRVDVSDVLRQTNHLVVEVDNSVNDRVYPQKADFTFYPVEAKLGIVELLKAATTISTKATLPSFP